MEVNLFTSKGVTMLALYKFVEVKNAKRRRKRLMSTYETDTEVLDILSGVDDVNDYMVEILSDIDNYITIRGGKFREITLRRNLDELGHVRHKYLGICEPTNGSPPYTINNDTIMSKGFEIPEDVTFGLVTTRYSIEEGAIVVEAIHSRIADANSVTNTIRRENEMRELSVTGFVVEDEPIPTEGISESEGDISVEE